MWTLKACPFNPEHTGRDAAVIRWSSGVIVFNCFHDSCSGKRWQDVRELFDGPQFASARESRDRREGHSTARKRITSSDT